MRDTVTSRATKSITLLEVSQDSPARPSHWSSTEMKTNEEEEEEEEEVVVVVVVVQNCDSCSSISH